MNNRLLSILRGAHNNCKKLFCAYLTLGFPTLKRTEEAIRVLEKAGADILELGFPFSDPLADGPTIQRASELAIQKGVRIENAFHIIEKLRKRGLRIPVLFFSYFNPILHYGPARMLKQLRRSGYDGLIVPDLALEEARELESTSRLANLSLVYLAAPTTTPARLRLITNRSSGFIYYVSLRGVTGARKTLPEDLLRKVRRIKSFTKKPVLAGFGVSNSSQARMIASAADGIVVGSALVERLKGKGNVRARIEPFARQLIGAMTAK